MSNTVFADLQYEMDRLSPKNLSLVPSRHQGRKQQLYQPWVAAAVAASRGGGGSSQATLGVGYGHQTAAAAAAAAGQQLYRDRGPAKSWLPQTMSDAIMSVLNDGLSLSEAARKFNIPYPTFVLYANRVHNQLGPPVRDAATAAVPVTKSNNTSNHSYGELWRCVWI